MTAKPIIAPIDSTPQVNNPSNWRDIDTSTPEGLRELNKVIAQRLSDAFLVFFEVDNGNSNIEIHSHRVDRDDPWFLVPSYSTVTDAALRLMRNLPRAHYFILTNRPASFWKAGVNVRYDTSQDVFEKAETPALAICKAWLAYNDNQGGAK